jgi:hypothetical protein
MLLKYFQKDFEMVPVSTSTTGVTSVFTLLLLLLLLLFKIFHFSALAGKYSPILGCIINRIRLSGLMCSLGNFLQLNMCQELPLFAFVYMCLGAG